MWVACSANSDLSFPLPFPVILSSIDWALMRQPLVFIVTVCIAKGPVTEDVYPTLLRELCAFPMHSAGSVCLRPNEKRHDMNTCKVLVWLAMKNWGKLGTLGKGDERVPWKEAGDKAEQRETKRYVEKINNLREGFIRQKKKGKMQSSSLVQY